MNLILFIPVLSGKEVRRVLFALQKAFCTPGRRLPAGPGTSAGPATDTAPGAAGAAAAGCSTVAGPAGSSRSRLADHTGAVSVGRAKQSKYVSRDTGDMKPSSVTAVL